MIRKIITAVICAAINTSSNFVYTVVSQNRPNHVLNIPYTTYVKSPCYHYVLKELTSQIEVRHISITQIPCQFFAHFHFPVESNKYF